MLLPWGELKLHFVFCEWEWILRCIRADSEICVPMGGPNACLEAPEYKRGKHFCLSLTGWVISTSLGSHFLACHQTITGNIKIKMAPDWAKRAKISFESVVLPTGLNCHTEIMLGNEFARGNNFLDSENTSESLRNTNLASLPLDLDIPMCLQNLQPPWLVLNLPPSTLCLSKNSKHHLPLLRVPLRCEGSEVWLELSSPAANLFYMLHPQKSVFDCFFLKKISLIVFLHHFITLNYALLFIRFARNVLRFWNLTVSHRSEPRG